MCTAVVHLALDRPLLVLALRDEATDRDFDDPGTWWPDQPVVVGGRDRRAGGSWCVTDAATGTVALVLNRGQHPAAEGAPSRGVLPLLAARHGRDWPQHLDVTGMAGFAVLLATGGSGTVWEFDGTRLAREELPPGTSMLTAGAAEQGRAARHLPRFRAAATGGQWRGLVVDTAYEDAPDSLLVRTEHAGGTYATVFAQVIDAVPGSTRISWSRTPTDAASWTTGTWPRG